MARAKKVSGKLSKHGKFLMFCSLIIVCWGKWSFRKFFLLPRKKKKRKKGENNFLLFGSHKKSPPRTLEYSKYNNFPFVGFYTIIFSRGGFLAIIFFRGFPCCVFEESKGRGLKNWAIFPFIENPFSGCHRHSFALSSLCLKCRRVLPLKNEQIPEII